MNKKKFWKLTTVALVTVLMFSLAPEIRLFGLMIDVIGVDIFLLMVEAQITVFLLGMYHQRIKPSLSSINARLRKMDPYYFVPSISQIRECPAITFHAAPFLVGTTFLLVAQVSLFA